MKLKHAWRCPKCGKRIPNRERATHVCTTPPAIERPPVDCVFRGPVVGSAGCNVCGEPREIPLYQCARHGVCAERKYRRFDQAEIDCVSCRVDGRGFRRRPRVGFLAVCYMPFGGTETWHRELLPALAESAEMKLVGFVSTWKGGGDVSRLGCPAGHGRDAAKQLAASVDVLVEWGTKDLAELLPRDRPAIVSMHHGDNASRWSRAMIDERADLADAIVCVSPAVAATLRGRGLPALHIANALADRAVVKCERRPRPRICWLGRFEAEKRPGLAVEVARLAGDLDFAIHGDGSLAADLRAAARGLRNVRIEKPGDSWRILAESDVMLATSTQEGFGYSIAESILSETAVVSSPVGLASVCGLAETVPVDAEPAAWATAIRRAAKIPRARLANARQYMLENHAPAAIVARWADLFHLLIMRRDDA